SKQSTTTVSESSAPAAGAAPEVESPRAKKTPSPPTAFKSWADFAQQFREVKDRANYCKSTRYSRLAQQAVEQLRTCAKSWHAQLERCLCGDDLDEATKALIAGADRTALEMFAAQCETSISNLKAID